MNFERVVAEILFHGQTAKYSNQRYITPDALVCELHLYKDRRCRQNGCHCRISFPPCSKMAKFSSILVAILLSFTVVQAELPAAAPGEDKENKIMWRIPVLNKRISLQLHIFRYRCRLKCKRTRRWLPCRWTSSTYKDWPSPSFETQLWQERFVRKHH
jgi:hypothetical protein